MPPWHTLGELPCRLLHSSRTCHILLFFDLHMQQCWLANITVACTVRVCLIASKAQPHWCWVLTVCWTCCDCPCRAAVVLLNIPIIIIGTRGYAVLSLFLVANLLTTCGLVPIILGLMTPLRGFITETGEEQRPVGCHRLLLLAQRGLR